MTDYERGWRAGRGAAARVVDLAGSSASHQELAERIRSLTPPPSASAVPEWLTGLVDRWRLRNENEDHCEDFYPASYYADELERAIAEHWGGGEQQGIKGASLPNEEASGDRASARPPQPPTAPSSTTEEVVEKAAKIIRDYSSNEWSSVEAARVILALALREAAKVVGYSYSAPKDQKLPAVRLPYTPHAAKVELEKLADEVTRG